MTMRRIKLTLVNKEGNEKSLAIEPANISMFHEVEKSQDDDYHANSIVFTKPQGYRLYVKETTDLIESLLDRENKEYMAKKEELRQKYIEASMVNSPVNSNVH